MVVGALGVLDVTLANDVVFVFLTPENMFSGPSENPKGNVQS